MLPYRWSIPLHTDASNRYKSQKDSSAKEKQIGCNFFKWQPIIVSIKHREADLKKSLLGRPLFFIYVTENRNGA